MADYPDEWRILDPRALLLLQSIHDNPRASQRHHHRATSLHRDTIRDLTQHLTKHGLLTPPPHQLTPRGTQIYVLLTNTAQTLTTDRAVWTCTCGARAKYPTAHTTAKRGGMAHASLSDYAEGGHVVSVEVVRS